MAANTERVEYLAMGCMSSSRRRSSSARNAGCSSASSWSTISRELPVDPAPSERNAASANSTREPHRMADSPGVFLRRLMSWKQVTTDGDLLVVLVAARWFSDD